MSISFTIAWRNIFRHKGKSLVIGAILFLGALIMTLGNGIITGLDNGIRQNIINSFTGDIALISDKQIDKAVLFPLMGQTIEVIRNYPAIKSYLAGLPFVDKFVPAGLGAAMLLSDSGEPDLYFLLGVDFSEYQAMFNNVEAQEGHLLAPGERGLMLTSFNRKMLYEYHTNYWVIPQGQTIVTANFTTEASENIKTLLTRDHLVFMGFNDKNTTLDILAPIKGIIKYKAFNKFWGLFNLIDIESFRECFGYVTAQDAAVSVNAQVQTLLTMGDADLENAFAQDSLIAQDSGPAQAYTQQALQQATTRTSFKVDTDKGMFNLVYVKFKPGTDPEKALTAIQTDANFRQLGVQAITWRQGLGQIADMAMFMKGALFVFVMFIFFVAIIIIMNTLSMAALERIPEIGMMRAVGAQRSFISKMFFYETALLSFFFGGMGILVGGITVKVLALLHFTTTNEMLQLFYGGDRFNPALTAADVVLGVIQLSVVTMIATIYPILVARRITPLEAITRD